MEISLRAMTLEDLPVLTGRDSPFDDFGPRAVRARPGPAHLDESGLLAITSDGELSGQVSWHWEHWGPTVASRCPDIGIWLIRAHRGRGVGAVAQRQLAELFFTHTAANRVQASTDLENLAEQRALERAGFAREGVLRGAQWRRGAYHDMVLYAVLRRDLS